MNDTNCLSGCDFGPTEPKPQRPEASSAVEGHAEARETAAHPEKQRHLDLSTAAADPMRKQIKDATRMMHALESPTMRALREYVDSPAARIMREHLDSPTARALRDYADSPTARMMRDYLDSPAAKALRDYAESPAARTLRDFVDSPAAKVLREFVD